MKKITLDMLRRYGDTLDAIADEAEAEYRAALEEFAAELGPVEEWSDDDKKAFRDFAAEQMQWVGEYFGDASASVGTAFFESVLEEGVPDGTVPVGNINEESARASTHYWAKHLWGDDPNVEGFVNGVCSKLNRGVRHAADVQTVEAALRGVEGGYVIKFARVPQGPSCGFCIMLASRGFVYATKETAGEFSDWHDRCNCIVVAGVDGLEVEGYDYMGMRKRYGQCRATLGGDKQLWRDWEALPQEKRDEYTEKYGTSDFDQYIRDRVCAEMDTRDRQWLFDGLPLPEPEREEGAKPKQKEVEAEKLLRRHGFRVYFRNDNVSSERTSDTYFISGSDKRPIKTKWEIKQPRGNTKTRQIGNSTIDHQFEEAAGQSRKLVLDVTLVEAYENTDFDDLCEKAEKLIHGKWKHEFDEVLVLGKDGLRRIVKTQ